MKVEYVRPCPNSRKIEPNCANVSTSFTWGHRARKESKKTIVSRRGVRGDGSVEQIAGGGLENRGEGGDVGLDGQGKKQKLQLNNFESTTLLTRVAAEHAAFELRSASPCHALNLNTNRGTRADKNSRASKAFETIAPT